MKEFLLQLQYTPFFMFSMDNNPVGAEAKMTPFP